MLAWAFFRSHETSQIHTVLAIVLVDSLETDDGTDTNTRLIQYCHLKLFNLNSTGSEWSVMTQMAAPAAVNLRLSVEVKF